jgi:hypothetical protein
MAFFPNGGDTPATLNLQIAKGATESLIITAHTQDQFRRWRLELALDDGRKTRALTIGRTGSALGTAEGTTVQPFETSGSLKSAPYRYLNGQWRPGR